MQNTINQNGWKEYLDAVRAVEFLETQQILKLHPVLGDGAQAPGHLVLRQFGEQWATHFYNDQDGGFHHGHYFATLDKAEDDFKKRVAEYSIPAE